MFNSELLDEVEPELSDLSETAVKNAEAQRQIRYRAKKANQTAISKEQPLVLIGEQAFKDANIPLAW